MQKFFTTFVGTTAFKYLIAMAATYLASKLGLDPVEGKATIEGLLAQFVGLLMGAWGVWESTRSKITLEGQVIARGKEEVVEIVSDVTKPNGDKLVGKVR